jgi:hypothetical protein
VPRSAARDNSTSPSGTPADTVRSIASLDAVARQMQRNVGAGQLAMRVRSLARIDRQRGDDLGRRQQRHRVADGTASRVALQLISTRRPTVS